MVVDLTLAQALHVATHMEPEALAQAMASCRAETPQEYAEKVLRASEIAWCVLAPDGEPSVMAGLVELLPHVLELWMVGTERLPECRFAFHRYALREVFPRVFSAGTWRLQASARADSRVHVAYLERLGFVREGMLRSLGGPGVDFIGYSMLPGEER